METIIQDIGNQNGGFEQSGFLVGLPAKSQG